MPGSWGIGLSSSWLDVFPSSGVLTANSGTNVTVTASAAAALLPYGDYVTTLRFTNNHEVISRYFTLQVRLVLNGEFQDSYSTNGVSEPVAWSLTSGSTTYNFLFANSGMIFSEPQANAVLGQSVPTVPGSVYLLSFQIETGNGPSYFGALWNNNLVYENQNPGVVADARLLVQASSTETELEFAGRSDGAGGYVVLSSVSLVPVPAATLHAVRGNAGTLNLSWPALVGLNYQLQYKTNLAQADWQDLGSPTTATNSLANTSEPLVSDPRRFYRVKIMP